MSTRLALFTSVAVILLGTACTKSNKNYCASNDDCDGLCDMTTHACEGTDDMDAGPADASPPDASVCTGDDQCTQIQSPICDDSSQKCRACEGTGATTECAEISGDTPYCASDGRCAPCAGIEGCTGDALTPVCDPTAFECRACEGSGEVAECMDIDSTRPRCAPDGRCVQCESHGDCGSEVCNLTTGTCAAPGAVLYIGGSNEGNTIGCGSSTSPCQTINYGLTQRISQPYVRLRDGNYFENLDIDLVTLTFVGPGAELVSGAGSTPVINVNNGADVTVDGLVVRGATGQSGIDCAGAGSKLTLRGGTRVSGNQGHGVDVADCDVRIAASTVKDNSSVGVLINGGDLEVRRSEISGNQGGGILVTAAAFTIINNFIFDNGKSGTTGASDLAGISINNIGFTTTETLMFNTIADNRARDGSSSFGVSCNVSGASTTRISSNIVYNNGSATVVSGNCAWRNSLYRGASGMGNITGDPKFKSGSDFHIDTDSPCRNAGESVSEVVVDFDGHERPEGVGHDMGADEFYP